MAILGIDIGGTKTAVLVATAAGDILARVQFPTESKRGFGTWLEEVVDATNDIRDAAPDGLSVVSVAVGGPLDENSGILIGPPHLPGWTELPLPERLGERLSLPVYWMHDARAGAWAEWIFGHGKETACRRLGHFTFATGFGFGVVLEGRLLNIPGEVGHWRVSEDGPELFGKRGSLEGLASGAGIEAQARASAFFRGDTALPSLAEYAREGRPEARLLFDSLAVQVGRQCARMIDLLGLDTISLGTIAVKCGDLLMDRVTEVVEQEALPELAAKCRILPTALGDRLGDYSALSAALAAGVRDDLSMGPSARFQLWGLAQTIDRVLCDRTLLAAIDQAAEKMVSALEEGGKVLTCGNGGSATDAAHLAEELVGRYKGDRPSIPAICLTTDGSVLTCIANDYGFEAIFSRQVEGLGNKGDVLVAFTTSGKSENVNRALAAARRKGLFTVAVTGKTGGTAKELADLVLLVPGNETERIQELHTFILHTLCEAVEARFATRKGT